MTRPGYVASGVRAEVVGVSRIAAKLDVSVHTVRDWVRRDDWPPPRGYVSAAEGGPGSIPWWHWGDILAFLEAHPTLGRSRRST